MRLLFFASGEFAVPTLRSLSAGRHEVAAVVTQPPRGSGRGLKATPTHVARWAARLGLPLIETDNVNARAMLDRLVAMEATLGLVVAFGQKLGADLLTLLPAGCVNLHASLLPKYRGAAPIHRAILAGEERTGVTVFRLVERMDAGPVLTTRWTYIKPEETAGELHDRLAAIGVDAVSAALAMFAEDAVPPGTPQDDTQATYARKLTKEEGRTRFDQPAALVARHICGMSPWPGATAVFVSRDGRQEGVTLLRARVAEGGPRAELHHSQGGAGGGSPSSSDVGEPNSDLRAASDIPNRQSTIDNRPSAGWPRSSDLEQRSADLGQPIAETNPPPSQGGAGGGYQTRSLEAGSPTSSYAGKPIPPALPPPGTIDPRRYVAAADGFVELLEIKPASGRAMTWADFVNGRHVAPGDRFVTPTGSSA